MDLLRAGHGGGIHVRAGQVEEEHAPSPAVHPLLGGADLSAVAERYSGSGFLLIDREELPWAGHGKTQENWKNDILWLQYRRCGARFCPANTFCVQASGSVAQSVEQGIENPRVGGSIPSRATIFFSQFFNPFFIREVAQPGGAPALGAGCRRFESCLPDHLQRIQFETDSNYFYN